MSEIIDARSHPMWKELGPPVKFGDQWRAAYAHGHTLLLTESEREELQASHRQQGLVWAP